MSDEKEVERRHNVVDMMLSMHSMLRDRYARYAAILDLVIFGGSAVLTATTLLDPHILAYLHVSDNGARIVLGIASTLVFFLSILSLRVDWKGESAKHRKAGTVLSALKARARLLGTSPTEAEVTDYFRLYDFAMAGIEPIAERHFLALKARHRRKVVLSKALDQFPATPVWVLRLRLLLTGIRNGVPSIGNETKPNGNE